MKKIILLVLLVSFGCPVVLFSEPIKKIDQVKSENFLTDYRLHPFQWIYPEYYYKAKIIPVKKEKIPPQGYAKIEFFGLSAYVPSQYAYEIKRKHDIMHYKSRSSERIIMIKSSDKSLLCSEEDFSREKDFCSAYKTPQEYNHKLFTLTPDTVVNTGDKWIVHSKGTIFENVKKIEIYSSDKYIAYVKFIKDSLIKERKFSHEITLFHVNGPINSHIIISFLTKEDTLMNNFLSTIE